MEGSTSEGLRTGIIIRDTCVFWSEQRQSESKFLVLLCTSHTDTLNLYVRSLPESDTTLFVSAMPITFAVANKVKPEEVFNERGYSKRQSLKTEDVVAEVWQSKKNSCQGIFVLFHFQFNCSIYFQRF